RQRRLALTRADDEIRPAGDHPRAVRERLQRILDRIGGDERRDAHCAALHTRSAVAGSSYTRDPIAFAIAFAIAPAVGTHGGSPTPFEPFGPPFCAGVSTHSTSILGASEAVTSL